MIRVYYRLAKPGIVYGNVFTTIAAFLFASRLHIDIVLFLSTVVGIGFVIASAAVFNNCLDRDMDAKMERTSKRALVTGNVSVRNAFIYGCILGLLGFLILYTKTNVLTATVALFGFVMYVGVYTNVKRTSAWAAVVGSIPGSVPIIVGYAAVTNQLDGAALILFIILALWQLPHFYAIALYRLDEYKAAGIPVLPAFVGVEATKRYIIACVVAYTIATTALTIHGYAGYTYLVLTFGFGVAWTVQCLRGYASMDFALWARRLFLFSLIVLVSFSVILAFSSVLP